MSERIFICITDGIVVNSIVADDDFVAAIRSDYDEVLEVSDAHPRPGVGWLVTSDGLRPEKPYPSWVWSEDRWIAPVPKPNDGIHTIWDEENQEWIAPKILEV